MKQLLLLLSLIVFSVSSFAQDVVEEIPKTFMDHLAEKDGKATVVLNQDARLDEIVNGTYFDDTPIGPQTFTVKKVVQKQKLKGYRIQVYWGGSQQSEKSKAQMAGYKVTALFPELQTYTEFESPHWRCRVGNFATIQEANTYLTKIKAAKVVNNPIVVNSVIYGYK